MNLMFIKQFGKLYQLFASCVEILAFFIDNRVIMSFSQEKIG